MDQLKQSGTSGGFRYGFQFFITLIATEALIISVWLQDWTVQINIYKNTPKRPQAVAELLYLCYGSHLSENCFILIQEKHAIAKIHSNFTTEWTQCCHRFTITVLKKIRQRNHHNTNIKSLSKIIIKKNPSRYLNNLIPEHPIAWNTDLTGNNPINLVPQHLITEHYRKIRKKAAPTSDLPDRKKKGIIIYISIYIQTFKLYALTAHMPDKGTQLTDCSLLLKKNPFHLCMQKYH